MKHGDRMKELELLRRRVAELEKTENKYREIFENIRDTYYEVALDGTILELSQSVNILSKGQYTKEELIGKPLSLLYKNPTDRDVFLKEIQKNGSINDYEIQLRNKDGSLIISAISAYIQSDVTGIPVKIIGTIRDIGDRKKAEEQTKRTEKKFRHLIENAPDGVVIIDANGIMIYGSPNAFRHFEYEEHEIIGHSGAEFTHPDDIHLVMNVFEKLFSNPSQSVSERYRFRRKDGEYRWIETTFTNLLEDEAVEGIVLNFSDITERKKAKEELIRAKEKAEINEARYKKAQEIGHIGSWEFNIINNSFWGSDEAKRIYNLDLNKAEFSSQEVMDCVIAHDRDWVNQALTDLITKNKPYDITFTIIPQNTSEKKVIRSIAETQNDKNGIAVKVMGVLQDITVQKTIEKELILAKEKAEESDKLKSAFLANMSHEIRTPMNGIMGFTNLLQEPGLSGEEQQKFIDIIQQSGKRMLNTVNDLIDISRIETGQVKVSIFKIDVKKELNSICAFFSAEAKQKNIKLILKYNFPENEMEIFTDRGKFTSILTNLIKNAIKYTNKGFIEIGCSKAEKNFMCYVKDTGIGIPRHRQKAVFDRFVQADIGDLHAFEGSGLGLAITKAYVEMLGGEIDVKSEIKKGTEFWFSLPLNTDMAIDID